MDQMVSRSYRVITQDGQFGRNCRHSNSIPATARDIGESNAYIVDHQSDTPGSDTSQPVSISLMQPESHLKQISSTPATSLSNSSSYPAGTPGVVQTRSGRISNPPPPPELLLNVQDLKFVGRYSGTYNIMYLCPHNHYKPDHHLVKYCHI